MVGAQPKTQPLLKKELPQGRAGHWCRRGSVRLGVAPHVAGEQTKEGIDSPAVVPDSLLKRSDFPAKLGGLTPGGASLNGQRGETAAECQPRRWVAGVGLRPGRSVPMLMAGLAALLLRLSEVPRARPVLPGVPPGGARRGAYASGGRDTLRCTSAPERRRNNVTTSRSKVDLGRDQAES